MMNQGEELSLSGTLTLDDFIKYNYYHLNKTLKLYYIFCFIVLFLVFQIPMSGNWLPIVIWAGFPSLLLSSLLYYAVKKMKRHQAIKEYRSDQLIKKSITYRFSEEEVIQVVRKSKNHFEWNDFLKAQEHVDMFLLYLSKNKAIVLPKRFFDSRNQLEHFRVIVLKNIDDTEFDVN